jgi:precorrin-6B methylase 2
MFRFITEVIGGRGDSAIMRGCSPRALERSAGGRSDNAIMRGCNPRAMERSARGRSDNAIMRSCYPSALQGSARGRGDSAIMREVESLRQEMLSDRRMVMVTDLGAGSSVMKSRERSVRHIASAAAVPKREAALLARIAESLNNTRAGEPGDADRHAEQSGTGLKSGKMAATDPVPAVVPDSGHSCREVAGHSCREDAGRDNLPVILELGTSLGISTLALALGAPQRRVISVEGCPELAAVARENLRRHGALNAEIICMEFGQALTDLHKKGVKVALAFIDGNHRGAAMTEYMHKIRQMGEEMIIIAHDIRMNRDMIKAWHSIVSGSAVYRQAAGRMKSHGDGQPVADISPGPALAGPVQATSQATTGPEPSGHVGPAKAPSLAPSEPAKTSSPEPSGSERFGCLWPAQSPSPALSGQAQTPSPAPSEQEQASAPTPPGPIQATLETLRMGMLFCIPSITPGHYRVRY